MLCPECGAPVPPPPADACAYCRTRFPPSFSAPPAAPAVSAPAAPAPQAPQPPAAQAKPAPPPFEDEPEAPVTSFAGMTDAYVAAKVKEHLGENDSLFSTATLGSRKEGNARGVHAAHLPPEEPIVALWDNTVFGAADDSVLLTARRVCWHDNGLSDAYMLPWRSLDPAKVRVIDATNLEVQGANMFVNGDGAARMADLLRALATEARRLSPPRKRAADPSDEAALLERIRDALGMGATGLYYAPSVPAAKEKAARAAYAGSLAGEKVLVLYDATVFGGAEDGFALSPQGIAWRRAYDEPVAFRYHQLDPSTIEVREGGDAALTVNGQQVELGPHADKLAAGLGRFLRETAGARR